MGERQVVMEIQSWTIPCNLRFSFPPIFKVRTVGWLTLSQARRPVYARIRIFPEAISYLCPSALVKERASPVQNSSSEEPTQQGNCQEDVVSTQLCSLVPFRGLTSTCRSSVSLLQPGFSVRMLLVGAAQELCLGQEVHQFSNLAHFESREEIGRDLARNAI